MKVPEQIVKKYMLIQKDLCLQKYVLENLIT